MSYLLLIVEPIGQRASRTPEAGKAVYEQMQRFGEGLQSRGLLIASNSLASTAKGGVRVNVREGRTTLIDGPFAEAKEMVGGFFLIDCETREEAVAIARQCPAAEWCEVEVRQTGPCYE
ncbi:YciI family protein [soil metagenome]